MIRINLLGRPRPRVKRRIAIAGTLQLILFLIPLVAAIVFLVVHTRIIAGEIARLETEIQDLELKKKQMGDLQAEINRFQQQEAVFRTRQAVIDELTSKKKGPALLLESIGETVNRTETLWITRLEERGNKITLEGVAGSVNAVANFITNLQASGFFDNIEIKEAVQSTENPGVQNFNFSLTCEFKLQTAPAQLAAPTPPPAAAGRAR